MKAPALNSRVSILQLLSYVKDTASSNSTREQIAYCFFPLGGDIVLRAKLLYGPQQTFSAAAKSQIGEIVAACQLLQILQNLFIVTRTA